MAQHLKKNDGAHGSDNDSEGFEHPHIVPTKIYFAVGGREGQETVDNVKRMMELVRQKSLPPENTFLTIAPDAEHNETAWRTEFPRAVEW